MDRQSSSQPTGRTAVYGWSGPLDPGGIAAGGREVGMQIYRLGISEEPLNCRLHLAPLHQLPAEHHCIPVERTKGELAHAQLLRHLIDGIIGLLALADVDCKTHAVRRMDGMVLVIDEQKLVAFPRIRQTDAAGVARCPAVGDSPDGSLERQLFVRQIEEMGELLGWQASDAEGHCHSSLVIPPCSP